MTSALSPWRLLGYGAGEAQDGARPAQEFPGFETQKGNWVGDEQPDGGGITDALNNELVRVKLAQAEADMKVTKCRAEIDMLHKEITLERQQFRESIHEEQERAKSELRMQHDVIGELQKNNNSLVWANRELQEKLQTFEQGEEFTMFKDKLQESDALILALREDNGRTKTTLDGFLSKLGFSDAPQALEQLGNLLQKAQEDAAALQQERTARAAAEEQYKFLEAAARTAATEGIAESEELHRLKEEAKAGRETAEAALEAAHASVATKDKDLADQASQLAELQASYAAHRATQEAESHRLQEAAAVLQEGKAAAEAAAEEASAGRAQVEASLEAANASAAATLQEAAAGRSQAEAALEAANTSAAATAEELAIKARELAEVQASYATYREAQEDECRRLREAAAGLEEVKAKAEASAEEARAGRTQAEAALEAANASATATAEEAEAWRAQAEAALESANGSAAATAEELAIKARHLADVEASYAAYREAQEDESRHLHDASARLEEGKAAAEAAAEEARAGRAEAEAALEAANASAAATAEELAMKVHQLAELESSYAAYRDAQEAESRRLREAAANVEEGKAVAEAAVEEARAERARAEAALEAANSSAATVAEERSRQLTEALSSLESVKAAAEAMAEERSGQVAEVEAVLEATQADAAEHSRELEAQLRAFQLESEASLRQAEREVALAKEATASASDRARVLDLELQNARDEMEALRSKDEASAEQSSAAAELTARVETLEQENEALANCFQEQLNAMARSNAAVKREVASVKKQRDQLKTQVKAAKEAADAEREMTAEKEAGVEDVLASLMASLSCDRADLVSCAQGLSARNAALEATNASQEARNTSNEQALSSLASELGCSNPLDADVMRAALADMTGRVNSLSHSLETAEKGKEELAAALAEAEASSAASQRRVLEAEAAAGAATQAAAAAAAAAEEQKSVLEAEAAAAAATQAAAAAAAEEQKTYEAQAARVAAAASQEQLASIAAALGLPAGSSVGEVLEGLGSVQRGAAGMRECVAEAAAALDVAAGEGEAEQVEAAGDWLTSGIKNLQARLQMVEFERDELSQSAAEQQGASAKAVQDLEAVAVELECDQNNVPFKVHELKKLVRELYELKDNHIRKLAKLESQLQSATASAAPASPMSNSSTVTSYTGNGAEVGPEVRGVGGEGAQEDGGGRDGLEHRLSVSHFFPGDELVAAREQVAGLQSKNETMKQQLAEAMQRMAEGEERHRRLEARLRERITSITAFHELDGVSPSGAERATLHMPLHKHRKSRSFSSYSAGDVSDWLAEQGHGQGPSLAKASSGPGRRLSGDSGEGGPEDSGGATPLLTPGLSGSAVMARAHPPSPTGAAQEETKAKQLTMAVQATLGCRTQEEVLPALEGVRAQAERAAGASRLATQVVRSYTNNLEALASSSGDDHARGKVEPLLRDAVGLCSPEACPSSNQEGLQALDDATGVVKDTMDAMRHQLCLRPSVDKASQHVLELSAERPERSLQEDKGEPGGGIGRGVLGNGVHSGGGEVGGDGTGVGVSLSLDISGSPGVQAGVGASWSPVQSLGEVVDGGEHETTLDTSAERDVLTEEALARHLGGMDIGTLVTRVERKFWVLHRWGKMFHYKERDLRKVRLHEVEAELEEKKRLVKQLQRQLGLPSPSPSSVPSPSPVSRPAAAASSPRSVVIDASTESIAAAERDRSIEYLGKNLGTITGEIMRMVNEADCVALLAPTAQTGLAHEGNGMASAPGRQGEEAPVQGVELMVQPLHDEGHVAMTASPPALGAAATEPSPRLLGAVVIGSPPLGAAAACPLPLGPAAAGPPPLGAAATGPPPLGEGAAPPLPLGTAADSPPPLGAAAAGPPPLGEGAAPPPPLDTAAAGPPPLGAAAAAPPPLGEGAAPTMPLGTAAAGPPPLGAAAAGPQPLGEGAAPPAPLATAAAPPPQPAQASQGGPVKENWAVRRARERGQLGPDGIRQRRGRRAAAAKAGDGPGPGPGPRASNGTGPPPPPIPGAGTGEGSSAGGGGGGAGAGTGAGAGAGAPPLGGAALPPPLTKGPGPSDSPPRMAMSPTRVRPPTGPAGESGTPPTGPAGGSGTPPTGPAGGGGPLPTGPAGGSGPPPPDMRPPPMGPPPPPMGPPRMMAPPPTGAPGGGAGVAGALATPGGSTAVGPTARATARYAVPTYGEEDAAWKAVAKAERLARFWRHRWQEGAMFVCFVVVLLTSVDLSRC